MSTRTFDSQNNAQLGKRVLDDLYIHTDYLCRVLEDPLYQPLVQSALAAMPKDDLKLCNVAKINLYRNRLSFLQYLNFEDDPFPTLNASWVFDPLKQEFSIRSYSNSLNPPILHRKELLVSLDHPQRERWQSITNSAEAIGLFSSGKPIGFRINWLRLIADKGFRIIDDDRDAIKKYGLRDLSKRLPPKPSDDAVKIIGEMFEASIDGEMYDPERWSEFFAPFGCSDFAQAKSSGFS